MEQEETANVGLLYQGLLLKCTLILQIPQGAEDRVAVNVVGRSLCEQQDSVLEDEKAISMGYSSLSRVGGIELCELGGNMSGGYDADVSGPSSENTQ